MTSHLHPVVVNAVVAKSKFITEGINKGSPGQLSSNGAVPQLAIPPMLVAYSAVPGSVSSESSSPRASVNDSRIMAVASTSVGITGYFGVAKSEESSVDGRQCVTSRGYPGHHDFDAASSFMPMDFPFREPKARRARSVDKTRSLRHFSGKVCEKVRERRITTYSEVADDLVVEFFQSHEYDISDPQEQQDRVTDEKNIRRRVYDALNVLMACGIISKEKKDIKWIGFPQQSNQQQRDLMEEKENRKEVLNQKLKHLQDLIVKQVAYKKLVRENRQAETFFGRPRSSSVLQLPFVLSNTDRNTVVDAQISSDKREFLFNFNAAFQLHDDIEILKRMGLSLGIERGELTAQNYASVQNMLPTNAMPFLDAIVHVKPGHGSCDNSLISKASPEATIQSSGPAKSSFASTKPPPRLSFPYQSSAGPVSLSSSTTTHSASLALDLTSVCSNPCTDAVDNNLSTPSVSITAGSPITPHLGHLTIRDVSGESGCTITNKLGSGATISDSKSYLLTQSICGRSFQPTANEGDNYCPVSSSSCSPDSQFRLEPLNNNFDSPTPPKRVRNQVVAADGTMNLTVSEEEKDLKRNGENDSLRLNNYPLSPSSGGGTTSRRKVSYSSVGLGWSLGDAKVVLRSDGVSAASLSNDSDFSDMDSVESNSNHGVF